VQIRGPGVLRRPTELGRDLLDLCCDRFDILGGIRESGAGLIDRMGRALVEDLLLLAQFAEGLRVAAGKSLSRGCRVLRSTVEPRDAVRPPTMEPGVLAPHIVRATFIAGIAGQPTRTMLFWCCCANDVETSEGVVANRSTQQNHVRTLREC
jgi:hypothetical protein